MSLEGCGMGKHRVDITKSTYTSPTGIDTSGLWHLCILGNGQAFQTYCKRKIIRE